MNPTHNSIAFDRYVIQLRIEMNNSTSLHDMAWIGAYGKLNPGIDDLPF